jgi:uncharacterized repeat protein (TIGR03803 family)
MATPTVTMTSPHVFTTGNDGSRPHGLVRGSDGNLYGTAQQGGYYGAGTLYQVTPPGGFSVLQEFIKGSDPVDAPLGEYPGPLVRGNGSTLFGTDIANSGNGIAGSGNWQNVYFFTTLAPYLMLSRCVFQNGAIMSGWLAEDGAGNIYGTATSDIGGAGAGFVFKCTPGFTPLPADGGGQFSIFHAFAGSPGGGGHEGGTPQALTLGADGNLYGITQSGGDFGWGTIYKLTPGGMLTVLHSFQAGEGNTPKAALVQGRDGWFYGTNWWGGTYDCGTIYRISSSGSFQLLYTFTGGADGGEPLGLTPGSDGALYGVTTLYDGTMFQLSSAGVPVTLYTFNVDRAVGGPNSPLVESSPGVFFGTSDSAVYKLVLH